MNRRRLCGLWATLFVASSAAAAEPGRVASINLCTDQLALALLPPERIVSLSYLATDPNVSYFHARARAFPTNRATAEELLQTKPDLVLADRYAARPTVAMLERFGIDVWRFDQPAGVDGIVAELERLGAALGVEDRARQLAADMRTRIATARQQVTPGATIAFFHPNSWASGAGTLADAALAELGLSNAVGSAGYQSFSLERLLATRADFLAIPTDQSAAFSQAAAVLNHPAIVARWPSNRRIELAGNNLICGGPFFAEAVEKIAVATALK